MTHFTLLKMHRNRYLLPNTIFLLIFLFSILHYLSKFSIFCFLWISCSHQFLSDSPAFFLRFIFNVLLLVSLSFDREYFFFNAVLRSSFWWHFQSNLSFEHLCIIRFWTSSNLFSLSSAHLYHFFLFLFARSAFVYLSNNSINFFLWRRIF